MFSKQPRVLREGSLEIHLGTTGTVSGWNWVSRYRRSLAGTGGTDISGSTVRRSLAAGVDAHPTDGLPQTGSSSAGFGPKSSVMQLLVEVWSLEVHKNTQLSEAVGSRVRPSELRRFWGALSVQSGALKGARSRPDMGRNGVTPLGAWSSRGILRRMVQAEDGSPQARRLWETWMVFWNCTASHQQ